MDDDTPIIYGLEYQVSQSLKIATSIQKPQLRVTKFIDIKIV